MFQAAGASAAEAQIVMEHLVGANLAGHDSHGIILLPTYIARIKRGHEEFKRDIAAFVAYLKETPPAEGFTEVLYPGELEYRTAQQRRRDGIYVEDETWSQLTALQQEYGLT